MAETFLRKKTLNGHNRVNSSAYYMMFYHGSFILSKLSFLQLDMHLFYPSSLSSGPVLRHLTESSITTTEINL